MRWPGLIRGSSAAGSSVGHARWPGPIVSGRVEPRTAGWARHRLLGTGCRSDACAASGKRWPVSVPVSVSVSVPVSVSVSVPPLVLTQIQDAGYRCPASSSLCGASCMDTDTPYRIPASSLLSSPSLCRASCIDTGCRPASPWDLIASARVHVRACVRACACACICLRACV
jgi:hypothetical protein